MIITMKKSATKADIEHVMKQLKDKGLQIHESIGENLNVFGVVGDTYRLTRSALRRTSMWKVLSAYHPRIRRQAGCFIRRIR